MRKFFVSACLAIGSLSFINGISEVKSDSTPARNLQTLNCGTLDIPINFGFKVRREEFPSHVSLKGLPVQERKEKFIELLLPLIERANAEVLKERAFLLSVIHKGKLSKEEEQKLEALKKKYRTDSIKELLKRVNTVPPSLVLAQAAVESGWGTSRFFTEANNIFGMYSFHGSKCMKARGSNACLKVYDNLYQSVKDYIYNLNVGWAYEKFRDLRSKGAGVNALLEALGKYSELEGKYVELVRSVIKKNNLERFDESEFASAGRGGR
ncbi:Mannosyl-glycoprotein endo-beta-N-acetylglucosamidase [Thermovibrio ammonificans HB-1]|uniref:Mannosyl-glycoprotein endo-beta-N-acetylglucosamidase n=1 Tax=Thermovibrio ammonificans (strain DSM 15698 / JCM 12110 / HB-1) TaxID=648996 RepID=E8T6B2_THEA1|nr:glucosaminidase domain-containing protein [Thermovibrio ammonificans]ADU96696.1 Mannosyl-glycoprotein endo-beta-N-acetylglucosamidase [Thermovibrio ammonificans HB-1]